MVLPTKVIETVIKKINKYSHLFPVDTKPVEGSEDLIPDADRRGIVVYADFDERADIFATGVPGDIPCSIYASCTSASFETAAESFNEAFLMAIKILKIITDEYYEIEDIEGNLEVVQIKAQEIPIVILSKSANGSTVQSAFTYNICGL